jgi:multicomponent Na+:H+ antiporter subunit D
MVGFILNAAVPPFHAWLPDAYGEATVSGAVFMCAFTTKTAVYVLVRGYPGTEILITLGVIMALYGAIYAILENDCRRLLAYHIISQVGYMVAGIGMGTTLAINGAVSHAIVHILYKSLLFMGAGAIIYVTGKRKLTELGGLYKYMPITLTLFIIGALSTSAFPLFSAFVSKSMIISAAAHDHRAITVLVLTLVGAGTCLYTGLKLPYYIFFGEDKGLKAKEPPFNMLIAMVIAAVLCVAIGVLPGAFYKLLPFATHYAPYTADHITGALGLLGFTALAFFFFKNSIAPKETISLDTDWFYRLWGNMFLWLVYNPLAVFSSKLATTFFEYIPGSLTWFSRNPLAALKIGVDTVLSRTLGPDRRPELEGRINTEKSIYPSDIIKHWPIGSTVLWVTIFLLIYLLVYFL